MKSKVAWLLPLALLIVFHGSLTAQEGSDAREWLTTADRSALLAEQKDSLPFSSPASALPTIDVNDMQQFQSVDGFGFALTGGSAQLLMRMDPGPRADLLKELFAPAGTAVSYIRVTIGGSDMNPKNTPSMVMFAAEQDTFIAKHLGPAFQSAGITTRILLYDHNPDVLSYALSILEDPAANKYVDGTAFHLYGGTASAMTDVHTAYPNKNLYMTEQFISSAPDEPLPIAAAVSDVLIAATRNWSRNVLLWNLAADSNNGPHTNDGGCTGCQGAITLNGSHATRNVAYYAVAHFSQFVPPGSVRVGTTELEQLASVAFLTADGKIVLVASNTANFPKTFNVKYHGRWFTTTVPEESVGTYVW